MLYVVMLVVAFTGIVRGCQDARDDQERKERYERLEAEIEATIQAMFETPTIYY